MLKRLRRWDLSTAKRVDRFLANSRETASRIDRIYGRASSVLPPPVDDRFLASPLCVAAPRRRFLAVGRLVPYKRFDLLIQASANLGFPLTIVGKGQEESRLRAMAARSGADVLFAGFIPDRDLPRIYATARAVFFPQFEDAGIVPLEAQACGAPVIALRRGGAMDTVVDGRTGILFPDQTVESIAQAISRFERTMFDPKVVRDHAQAFGAGRFRKKLQEEVENAAVQRDTVRCAKSEI
jgi:glycosyltransferase involved in cell wall biosynthesis